MPRGRIPNPKAINDLRGDPGRRRRYEKEPTPPTGIPSCPDYLDEIAKGEWSEIVGILKDMNLMSLADGRLLEIYCTSYSRWRRALVNVAKYGEVILDKKSGKLVTSPYAHIASRMQEEMRKCLLEFGMTPAARSRMRVSIEPPKPENKWVKFKAVG